ncbi:MAG TPA: aminotransferase class I/II-fold pyridoxal phosphate-dependent enzyme [Acidimicrobiales bacterium]
MSTVPPPGAHGGDGASVAQALGIDPKSILDLSQSLNPVALDPRPVIAAHLDAIGRYPDPRGAHEALAAVMGVNSDRLLLTNGGAEAITLVANELGGTVSEPEFSLHPRGTGPKWRSNPHSPSGLLAETSDRADVWDEAFYPLATGQWSRGERDAVVVGSLTKVLACPGLRVGYVLADPAFIETLRRHQPMWSLNGLASSALPELLAPLDIANDFVAIGVLRQRLRALLRRHGLTALPSDANWLLVKHRGLREALALDGVVVRDCTNFGLVDTSRIAVPNEDGLERLERALDRMDRRAEQTSGDVSSEVETLSNEKGTPQ